MTYRLRSVVSCRMWRETLRRRRSLSFILSPSAVCPECGHRDVDGVDLRVVNGQPKIYCSQWGILLQR